MKQRSIGLDIVKSLFLSIVPTFLVAAMLLAVTPHALGAHEGGSSVYSGTREVRLTAGALFDGQRFEAGVYQLSWRMNRDRDVVEVRLYQGRRMVASATGRLVEREAASAYDSVVFSRARTGHRELTEIRFAGSEAAISLMEDGSSAVAGTR